MRIAVCPGSFDPITLGHLDIIERASRIFDRCIVAVFPNLAKKPLFSVEERVEMVREAVAHLPNVEVEASQELLADFAKKRGVTAIVKGLRAVSDYEYEVQMAQMNYRLAPEVETLFLVARGEHAFLSSSIVKEVARFHGNVDDLVPPNVARALKVKFSPARKEKV
ncbi:MAG: pantetheine-phosphate adenylyltransferase [Clostridiales bacterium]|nr:pantetheine-phosphate adenylyltransferase [Clostridiales bacterium]